MTMRYEKGRKDASRQKILDVASERFRTDGIAASGLAGIMKDAGLSNGAFYPHFPSKAALVQESVSAALQAQSLQIAELLQSVGVAGMIDAYLSTQHRDDPGHGCASSALLPEIAREPGDTRALYTQGVMALVDQLATELPAGMKDREGTAVAIYSTLIGALELARAVEGEELSQRILASAAAAAKALATLDIEPKEKLS
ncbi:MAG TPA: TetR/AcrR family transcriptional regulator [Devosia sp.]|nr:TetR/AcrR family transcriptional regulator [Devosia sp.]